MKIDFSKLKEITVPHMNGGMGECRARMFMDPSGKIIWSVLPKGSSIGKHLQKTSNDVNYIISGECKAIDNGVEETLKAGDVHYCPKGHEHSIINIGNEDLVLLTVVTEI